MPSLLSELEEEKIIEWLSTFSAKGLEEFYRDMLLPDILPRATPQQRKTLYKHFIREYKVKCRTEHRTPKNDIMNEGNWLSVGKPKCVSNLEMKVVLSRLRACDSINELQSEYDWIKNNVFPRATSKQISSIMKTYDSMLVKLRKDKEYQVKIRKSMKKVENANRPEVGQRVSMDGEGGVVVDRMTTNMEVRVKWDDGRMSWIHPKYLKW